MRYSKYRLEGAEQKSVYGYETIGSKEPLKQKMTLITTNIYNKDGVEIPLTCVGDRSVGSRTWGDRGEARPSDCRPSCSRAHQEQLQLGTGTVQERSQFLQFPESSEARWVEQRMTWKNCHSAKNRKWELLSLVGADLIIIKEIGD